MNDEECLKKIVSNLKKAMINLQSAENFITKRERDYYHYCNGFSKLVHQVENLYSQYYDDYCREVTKRVIEDEHGDIEGTHEGKDAEA